MNFNRGIDPKSSMEIGRGRYSRDKFEGYRYRITIEVVTYVGVLHRLDVYTDQTDVEKVKNELWRRRKDTVSSIKIENWTSREQDDRQSEFIEEVFKNL